MAKYDKDTKFYWLQLKEDFFEEDAIEWLEEQENGHKYSLFYLKLCLKSLKSNGILIRKVGKMLVPYDNKKLAEMTKMPVDTVIVAMELLKGIGLINILENGELYMTQLEHMIGSASKGALKKQQQRSLKKQQQELLPYKEDEDETKGGQVSTKDRDRDRDRDKIKNKNKKEIKKDSLTTIIDDLISDTDIKEALCDFIKMRKLIKKPMTDRALKQLIKKLFELSSKKDDQLQILDNAIINNWSSIYPLKQEKNNYQPKQYYKREEVVPDWLHQQQETKPLTEDEKKEMEDILKNIVTEEDDFETHRNELQERLRAKYSPNASKRE